MKTNFARDVLGADHAIPKTPIFRIVRSGRSFIRRKDFFTLFACILVFTFAACARQSEPDAPAVSSAWRSFAGTWNASGTRQTLHLGAQHSSIARFSGSLILTDAEHGDFAFRSEALAYSDDVHGMIGSAVWTDERGDQVFSELSGQRVGTGNRAIGKVTGGTGRYAQLVGGYEFEWQYVIAAEDGAVQGRAIGFTGRFRRDESAGATPAAGPSQGREP